MEITAPREVDLSRVIGISLLVVISVAILSIMYQNRFTNRVASKVRISDSNLKSSPPKKKRA
ncbi:serine/threonine-protein kinase ppk4-like, partial [Trifolium medium]|nr:serine/threonine-protein kinase ppk4-like [Trifolium medium]